MVRARRAGHGLYVNEWHLDAAAGVSVEELAAQIVDWCRQTIAGCRRPYGIDHFDLALARSRGEQGPPRSAEFRDLHPLDLYGESRVNQRVAAFLNAGGFAGGPVRVAAALYSWGDAAYAALPAAS
jgi:hypothetical protein